MNPPPPIPETGKETARAQPWGRRHAPGSGSFRLGGNVIHRRPGLSTGLLSRPPAAFFRTRIIPRTLVADCCGLLSRDSDLSTGLLSRKLVIDEVILQIVCATRVPADTGRIFCSTDPDHRHRETNRPTFADKGPLTGAGPIRETLPPAHHAPRPHGQGEEEWGPFMTSLFARDEIRPA